MSISEQINLLISTTCFSKVSTRYSEPKEKFKRSFHDSIKNNKDHIFNLYSQHTFYKDMMPVISKSKRGNYYYIHFNYDKDILKFDVINSMNSKYENKDIYISKLKFFRMKYLSEKIKVDIARVEFRNGKASHLLINYINDDIFEVDLTKINAKFNEITQVKFFKNN